MQAPSICFLVRLKIGKLLELKDLPLNPDSHILIKGPNRREHPVFVASAGPRMFLGQGWDGFVVDNNFKESDVLLCSLRNGSSILDVELCDGSYAISPAKGFVNQNEKVNPHDQPPMPVNPMDGPKNDNGSRKVRAFRNARCKTAASRFYNRKRNFSKASIPESSNAQVEKEQSNTDIMQVIDLQCQSTETFTCSLMMYQFRVGLMLDKEVDKYRMPKKGEVLKIKGPGGLCFELPEKYNKILGLQLGQLQECFQFRPRGCS